MSAEEKAVADQFRENPAAIAIYLTENLKKNDITETIPSLSAVMKAQNVQMLARDSGMRRDALYRTFGGRIDPQFGRVLKLFHALNVEPRITPIATTSRDIAAQLNQAVAGSPETAIQALGSVVKSQNISSLALKLGIMRTTVYKTFGGTVDPQMGRVLNLFAALGVRLEIFPATEIKVRLPRPQLGRPRKPAAEC